MRNAVLRKILQDDKLYSLTEFRNKIYDDLDLTRSDLAILLCAMLIASIGLNMDSTPVIIGAMLISPLMTPILGIGFSLAILDMNLLRKSFKILFIQVSLSLIASTVYFLISPISYASTEIIARTSPTIWDVVIAFVGGLAGVIGARKKEANNIIENTVDIVVSSYQEIDNKYSLQSFKDKCKNIIENNNSSLFNLTISSIKFNPPDFETYVIAKEAYLEKAKIKKEIIEEKIETLKTLQTTLQRISKDVEDSITKLSNES